MIEHKQRYYFAQMHTDREEKMKQNECEFVTVPGWIKKEAERNR